MTGAFSSFMLLSSACLMSSTLGPFHRILEFLDRGRRHAPVVAGKGLTITNGEVHAPRILERLVRFLGPLRNGAGTSLAKGMSARRAVRAEVRDPGQADVAGPHRGRVGTVCSIEACKDFGQILHRDEAAASGGRAARSFFRELAGRTVDAMLFEELARLCHRAARWSWRRWRRHGEVGVPRYTAKGVEWHDRR